MDFRGKISDRTEQILQETKQYKMGMQTCKECTKNDIDFFLVAYQTYGRQARFSSGSLESFKFRLYLNKRDLMKQITAPCQSQRRHKIFICLLVP